MIIHELSDAECRRILAKNYVARLACARNNRPYVVPLYYGFDGEHIYVFSTLGQKINWMRANPYVCLETDERIDHSNWVSVIVFGRYEELPDEPQFEMARSQAQKVLQRRAMWWEPAIVADSHRDKPGSLTPVIYRIHIESITGHRATPDSSENCSPTLHPAWNNVLRHLRLA